MGQKQWVLDPDSGGTKIPETVRHRTEGRLRRYAEEQFAGRYTRLQLRFRGQFCYIDAYTEPEPVTPTWPPADWPESREEYLDRPTRQKRRPVHQHKGFVWRVSSPPNGIRCPRVRWPGVAVAAKTPGARMWRAVIKI